MIVLRHRAVPLTLLGTGELTMVGTQRAVPFRYAATSCRGRARWIAREAGPPAPQQPRLLDRVRAALRARHYSDGLVRAKRPQHLPTVLTREEVRTVLEQLDRAPRLMALLLYGAGSDSSNAAARGQDRSREARRAGASAAPTRPRRWRGLGRAAVGARPEVSERRARVGVAMGVPGHALVRRPFHGPTSAAPSA